MRSEVRSSGSLYSVIIMMVMGFFFLTLNQSHSEKDIIEKQFPFNISVSSFNAIPGPVIKVQFLQKSWIVNKDSFKLLAFNRSPLFTSRKADLKISDLTKERLSFVKKPPAIKLYHLFPPDTDDPHC
jgi:hypothetical protein